MTCHVESSAWQKNHMKFQDLFSLKNKKNNKKKKKKKKLECCLLQILLGALRVNVCFNDKFVISNYSLSGGKVLLISYCVE